MITRYYLKVSEMSSVAQVTLEWLSRPVLDEAIVDIVRSELHGVHPTYKLVRQILQRCQLRYYYSYIPDIIRRIVEEPDVIYID